ARHQSPVRPRRGRGRAGGRRTGRAGLNRAVDDRRLNRWTLARQMLLKREPLDAVTAIARLAGMQAQYSPAPYIGLWSRIEGFERDELERHVRDDRVLKATLMRGTLHLVAAHDFDRFRAATRNPFNSVARMRALGVDTDAVRAAILAAAAERPLDRAEIGRVVAEQLPPGSPVWGAWHAVAISGALINLAADASFGYFGGSRYRLGPPDGVDREVGRRHLVAAYLAAFGPATRADLAQWSGQTLGSLARAIESLDLVELRHEDGRILLDLASAPRPEDAGEVPVRFLPKWDNLLLAYARRGRV